MQRNKYKSSNSTSTSSSSSSLASTLTSIFASTFTSHAGFRRYFINTSWLFAEKILRMVMGLLVGVWVARYLGPERFGLLSYAKSFVGANNE